MVALFDKPVNWFHGDTQERLTFDDQRWDRDLHTSFGNAQGPGIYWTSSREQAEEYGPYLYRGQTRSDFRFIPHRKPTLKALRCLYDQASAEDAQTFLDSWDEGLSLAVILRKYSHQDTLFDAYVSLYGDLIRNPAAWVQAVRACGYDGVIVKLPQVKHLVVYSPQKMRVERLW